MSTLFVACGAWSAHTEKRDLPRAMPQETRIDLPVRVEGGPRKFQTEHFEFEADQDVSTAFIAEAARVFEGTYEAIAALPMGIEPRPPEGMQRFKARFVNRAVFDTELAGRIEAAPGMLIAGAYVANEREILVPYSSIGAKQRRRQMTLGRSSDTTTLIHEVTHQLMHDWLPLLPPWLFEGMAEYIAAVPYDDGRFDFRGAARGLKQRLEEKYQTDAPVIHSPGALVDGDGPPWANSARHYLTGMMMTFYFVHLERGGQGEALSAYFSRLKQVRDDTDRFIRDYNDAVREFEQRRTAYREQFDAYEARHAIYRTAVQERNRLVEQYNAQLDEDVPAEQRVDVPAVPEPPKAPATPVVPTILEERPRDDGPIDVAAEAKAKARPSLLLGRDRETLAADMIEAFAAIGIELSVAPGSAVTESGSVHH